MSVTDLSITDRRWTDFIARHPDTTIFHHPAWSEMLAECYGYRPLLLAVIDDTGQIAAGLPMAEVKSWLTGHRLVSLPFSDFCQPLAVDHAALDEMVQELPSWRREHNWPRAEIHWPLPNRPGIYPQKTVARHVTNLTPDVLQISKRLKGSVVRCIRQSEKAGVVIRRGESWDDLKVFYGLHLQTRQRQGTPIQPLRFFRLLWERLLSPGQGYLLLAHKGSQPLAGAVFLHINRVLTYKYGASDPAYWHLRPNNLIFWHAIRWACERGYQSFDWGKTDLENEGLRDFKRGWDGEEHLLSYSVLSDRPPKPQGAGQSQRLLAALIQQSPAWVCRAIGEGLYAHYC